MLYLTLLKWSFQLLSIVVKVEICLPIQSIFVISFFSPSQKQNRKEWNKNTFLFLCSLFSASVLRDSCCENKLQDSSGGVYPRMPLKGHIGLHWPWFTNKDRRRYTVLHHQGQQVTVDITEGRVLRIYFVMVCFMAC